jgi:hypothetical protein
MIKWMPCHINKNPSHTLKLSISKMELPRASHSDLVSLAVESVVRTYNRYYSTSHETGCMYLGSWAAAPGVDFGALTLIGL